MSSGAATRGRPRTAERAAGPVEYWCVKFPVEPGMKDRFKAVCMLGHMRVQDKFTQLVRETVESANFPAGNAPATSENFYA